MSDSPDLDAIRAAWEPTLLDKLNAPFKGYNYAVEVRQINTDLWHWQVDGEEGNGVFGFGFARTRPRAVRRATRCMRQHAHRRGNRPDDWWKHSDD